MARILPALLAVMVLSGACSGAKKTIAPATPVTPTATTGAFVTPGASPAATPSETATVLPGALATAPRVVPSLPPSPASGSTTPAPPPTRSATLPPTASPSPSNGHAYFASTAPGSDTLYCDTDPGWQQLDPATRVSFISLADALAVLPKYHLNRPC